MLNRVTCIGRLTKDPELKQTSTGKNLCSFTIAIDSKYKNTDGKKETTYISCIVFQQSAENMVKYTKKGSLVGVDGKLNQRSYLNQEGKKVFVYEIICDSVQFLDSKNSGPRIEEINVVEDTIASEDLQNDCSPF